MQKIQLILWELCLFVHLYAHISVELWINRAHNGSCFVYFPYKFDCEIKAQSTKEIMDRPHAWFCIWQKMVGMFFFWQENTMRDAQILTLNILSANLLLGGISEKIKFLVLFLFQCCLCTSTYCRQISSAWALSCHTDSPFVPLPQQISPCSHFEAQRLFTSPMEITFQFPARKEELMHAVRLENWSCSLYFFLCVFFFPKSSQIPNVGRLFPKERKRPQTFHVPSLRTVLSEKNPLKLRSAPSSA